MKLVWAGLGHLFSPHAHQGAGSPSNDFPLTRCRITPANLFQAGVPLKIAARLHLASAAS